MKKITTMLFLAFFSTSVLANGSCPSALPTNDAGFCPSFQAAASCYCTASGVPKGMCQDVKTIYKRMIAIFGTVQRACEYQKNTPVQVCVDDWNCYMNGGKDSAGQLCSGTGKSC